jgi:hypothetical protein
MQFLQPALLWGVLAVAVPIALHFWHRKRGQPLPWATLRWFTDPNQQPNRGLQFDNWLLLALRCAGVLALAGLLAQPVFTETTAKPAVKKVHLVEPTALITGSFRFELEAALKEGEPVFWISETTTPTTALLPLSTAKTDITFPLLQSTINRLNRPDHELHLYLTNRQSLADGPPIVVPKRFRLHTAMPTTKSMQSLPGYTRPISVRMAYRNPAEKQVIKAGLQALTDVYGFVFSEQTAANANQEPNLVLSDITPKNPSASTLYIVSQKNAYSPAPNVIFCPDTLTLPTSELVANGQLPEWLGKQLVRHLGLINNDLPVSSAQLTALFIRADTKPEEPAPQTGQTLWLLGLISLVTAERWVALRKNA